MLQYKSRRGLDAKACNNQQPAAFASNRGGFNEYNLENRTSSARLSTLRCDVLSTYIRKDIAADNTAVSFHP